MACQTAVVTPSYLRADADQLCFCGREKALKIMLATLKTITETASSSAVWP